MPWGWVRLRLDPASISTLTAAQSGSVFRSSCAAALSCPSLSCVAEAIARRGKRAKAAAIEAPAIVAIDPKTRVAKKGRRLTEPEAAAREGSVIPPASGSEATAHSSTESPQPANDDGPRNSVVVPAKKGPRLRDERTAAQVVGGPPRAERAGEHQPNPPAIARKSAIVTVRGRKTVQRQREQQGEPKQSAIVTARKPRPWRSPEPEMMTEEHKRRGDAADALFQEMKRKIAAALKKP